MLLLTFISPWKMHSSILCLLSWKLALSFNISIMISIFLLEIKYAVRHYKNRNDFLIIESYFTLNGLTSLSYFQEFCFSRFLCPCEVYQ